MPSDEAVRPAGRSELIRTPDQLQQAKRSESERSSEPADRSTSRPKDAPCETGILGQLETERAHD